MMAMRQTVRTLGVLAVVFATTVPALAAKGDKETSASLSRSELIAAAKKVDEFVAKGYEAAGVKAQPIVSDTVFLRRAYLDIVGRNPTVDEVKAFMANKDRKKLVDKLIDSEGFVQNQFNYWADLLRIKSRLNNNVNGAPYIEFVKDSIRENKPYDRFVYELLTAEGRIFDNGASGYHLRDVGMPLDNMAVTVRVFLGTSIGCAQCHDHPFDKWTQLEFFQMSAYTYGLEYRERGMVNARELYKMAESVKGKDGRIDRRLEQAIRNIVRVNSYGLHDNAKRQIKLPDDYKYDDAKPGQAVEPMTIFGSEAKLDDGATPRQAFAKWLASRDNPRFALTIANRLWKKVMGQGLYEPVDEITDKSKPTHPELMQFLTEQVLATNFNLKDYLRILYYTDTYQRATLTADLGPEEVYAYQGRLLRRLSAEQMWDSFVTLVNGNVDDDSSTMVTQGAYYDAIDIKGKSPAEVLAMAKEAVENPRRLQMARGGKQRGGGGGAFASITRSSAMESPARPGHFLREFGQSDREQVEAASTNPSITQVLQLLNGQIDSTLLDKRSHLMKQVESTKNIGEKVNIIFTAILSRPPTSGEARMAASEISRNNEKGVGNVIWALLNTREFMFIQ